MQFNIRPLSLAAALIASGLIVACNGGVSNGSTSGGTSSGSVSFAITDASSDQIESFTVDVTELRLGKADGAFVSLISAPVTVDLATLTDTAQILNIASVPAGIYTTATISIDFTHASCVLVGQSTSAAILDDAGLPVTGTLTLPMQFGQNSLQVLNGKQRLVELDFDLDQSLDADTSANSVRLESAFVLRMGGSQKPLFTAGTLVSVDTAAQRFVGSIKTMHGAVLSNATYDTTAATLFQIDGIPAQGSSGLALLKTKPAGTWIQTYGTIDPNSPNIKATYVEAGIGTYGGGTDTVEGHILDRIDNPLSGSNITFVVRGRSSDATQTIFQHNALFTVNTSFADTKVVRTGSPQAFHIDQLNVGQRVRIFGALSGTMMNASFPTSVVRQQEARAFGFARGPIQAPAQNASHHLHLEGPSNSSADVAVPGTLTMNLIHVDLLPTASFMWIDSGTTAPAPANLTVSSGHPADGLGLTNGTPVEARGFFSATTDAHDDFVAASLTNLDSAPSLLLVKNLHGGMTVDVAPSSGQIQLLITGSPGPHEKAIIDHGYAGFVALPASPVPTVRPAGPGSVYMLRDKQTGTVTAYANFGTFARALGDVLSLGATLESFGAVGVYTRVSNSIVATTVSAVVE